MSKTYLQDFGVLRRAMRDQEVNDPMSGAGRWDDLQLDLRKPHIPRERRSPVPSNPKLVIGGVSMAVRAKAVGDVANALGFHSTGSYKHRLVTMQAETYRNKMGPRPDQTKLWAEPKDPKFKHDNIRAAIRSLVNKARHNPIASVSEVYKHHIRVLWTHRHVTGFGQRPATPPKPSLAKLAVQSPKPKTERVIPPSALAEFGDIQAKLSVMDREDKDRVALLMRQRELRSLMWGQP